MRKVTQVEQPMSSIDKNYIQGREVRVVFRQTRPYQAIGSLLREEGLFTTIDKVW